MELIDAKKQEKAKKYFFSKLYSDSLSSITAAVFLLILLLPSVQNLQRNLFSSFETPLILRSIYFSVFFLLLKALTFIFSYIGGFRIEHRFGFSKQSFGKWVFDYFKSFLLSLVIGLIAVNVFYYLTGLSENLWWLWTAIFIFAFTSLLQRLATVLLIPIFYRLEPLEDEGLKQSLTRMASKAGADIVEICKIFLGDKTKKPNAAVSGLGKTRRMLLGDTLIENYDNAEVEAVMAHELSHSVRRHIPKLLAADGFASLVSLYILFRAFPFISRSLQIGRIDTIYSLPAVMLTLGIINFAFKPFLLMLSRKFEKQADRDSIELSGMPEKFISVMASFANKYLSYADPPKIIKWFYYSHPPARERILRAQSKI